MSSPGEKAIPGTSESSSGPSSNAGSNSSHEICFLRAVDILNALRTKKLSAREVMGAHLQQIHRVNPKVNAVVTLVPEDQLMAQASAADEALAKGKWLGPLHGLPVGVKDLHETKGIRTTFGSPLHKDYIPDFDCRVVQREKNAGAIVLGKTNVPEFGLGSQTFNPVFGPTRNPYDLTKTCGGSTGGGAVALACGMVPLADGSDFGGSLRNPPNFCSVVGFRPSPGRVPNVPAQLGWFPFSVIGPVARNVTDCAFFLSVMAGFDHHSPISIDQSGSQFAQPLEARSFKGVRVAMFQDMGLPWDSEVKNAVQQQRKVFESLGCIVEDTEPDFHGANEYFLAWRHWSMELKFGDLLATHGDQLNEYVHWHVAEGRKLTGPMLSRLEAQRTALYQRLCGFQGEYDFFVLPVNQVLPFDVNTRYPTEIAGVKMENYMAWMKSAYYISVCGNPAISVPCAFSASGLPIGLQIVGRHHDDWGVLQLAYAFEQAASIRKRLAVV
ncbi:MAG: amidase [Acidobacteriaceae bacterium]|nr:amidase [Acidobacteriaceae bacterium]MBV9939172.1 amidase [Acidobacteriaceae bacterium]